MKIMNKFQKKLANRKKDNKGFSLVELIIVIAIMAILVGIVGTQVLPYINKSKEAKDLQIINSYCTAAATAYASNAEKISTTASFDVDVYSATALTDDAANKKPLKTLQDEIKTLTGYNAIGDLTKAMGSKKGQGITTVKVTFDVPSKKITAQAYKGAEKVFDEVVTQL